MPGDVGKLLVGCVGLVVTDSPIKKGNHSVPLFVRIWLPDQYRLGTAEPMVTRLALVVELPNKWKKAA